VQLDLGGRRWSSSPSDSAPIGSTSSAIGRRTWITLTLLPFQPFECLPDFLASTDVLLVLLEADAGRFSVPSKILSYLCETRPVLGAVPSGNAATRTLTQRTAGVVVAHRTVANW
jgi:hypothetical protein